MSELPTNNLEIGALYIIGFAQARAPHAGVFLATSSDSGVLFHIRIDRESSPNWAYQVRRQKVTGDMFCSTLVRIHRGDTPIEMLSTLAENVDVPANDEFGECLPWVLRFIRKLSEAGILEVPDVEAVGREFDEFAAGNRAYAKRTVFPNVKISEYAS